MTSVPPAAPRSRPRLTWTDAAGAHALELSDRRTTGSAVHCELVIADRAVSRLHCELAAEHDGLWVRDLGSRNGTYVNGVKVTEARVPAGATIRIGMTDLGVTYEAPEVPSGLWPEQTYRGLVGSAAVIREVFGAVERAARGDAPVILEGEPGTGKRSLARALHDASPLAGQPFVTIDCAALPAPAEAVEWLEELLTSAEGGTLHLDEPAELPLELQRELSPVLDAKAFRVVVTTSRDLRRAVNQGAFREALYFRLAGVTVRVPPLRERLVDLPLLLERFLGERMSLVSASLMSDFERLPWLGNVNELRIVAERLHAGDLERQAAAAALHADEWAGGRARAESEVDFATTAETPAFSPVERPTQVLDEAAHALPPLPDGASAAVGHVTPWFSGGFKEFRERWIEVGEREYLRRLMDRTQRSSGAAAKEAGLERTYLYRLLKKHGV